MPPTSHRRLTRALKATIVLALCALIVSVWPEHRRPVAQVATVAPATTVPLYVGPTTDTWHELGVALKRAQLAAFFEWASQQPTTTTTVPRTALRESRNAEPAPAPSGDARQAIAAHFGDIYDQAVRVADCESGLDPASGPSRTGDYGLFQLHRAAHRDSFEAVTGVPFDEGWSDPNLNAMFARWLYNQSGGWGPWTCRWAAR